MNVLNWPSDVLVAVLDVLAGTDPASQDQVMAGLSALTSTRKAPDA